MDMPVRQEAKLIEALGPKLERAGLGPKLLGYDHNWSEHPNDIANTPPGEDPETEYPTDLLNSRAGRWLAGTAFHCYAGDVERQTELAASLPAQGRLVHRVLRLARRDRPAAAGVLRHAQVAHAQPRARRHPQLGQDRRQLEPRARPRPAARTTAAATPAPACSRSARATRSPRTPSTSRSATSRASSQPGAERIASTSFGTTGWNGQIMDVAFRNRDGSTALVVHNENDDPRTFAVAQGGRRSTTRCRAARSRRSCGRRRSTTATGCSTRRSGPTEAVDDDATTTWSGERSTSTSAARSACAAWSSTPAPPRLRAPPRSRSDGKTWTADGGGQLTTFDIPATQARYLRVAFTTPATVADVRIYR